MKQWSPKSKYIDCIIMKNPTSRKSAASRPRPARNRPSVRAASRAFPALTVRRAINFFLVSKFSLVLILAAFVLPLSAFEAHVINVTATIERPPNQCDALSVGYWRNHEGCTQGGNGSTIWASQVSALSSSLFSGVFASTTGSQMCNNLWIPNCPSGSSLPAKLCKAKAMTLGDELNLVSGRLDLPALLAGADNGSSAFLNLGLNSNSTVQEALTVIEAILANPGATGLQLTDAATVAERIYSFYEDENPQKPACIYSLEQFVQFTPSSAAESPKKDKNDTSESTTLIEEAIVPDEAAESEEVLVSEETANVSSTESVSDPSATSTAEGTSSPELSEETASSTPASETFQESNETASSTTPVSNAPSGETVSTSTDSGTTGQSSEEPAPLENSSSSTVSSTANETAPSEPPPEAPPPEPPPAA